MRRVPDDPANSGRNRQNLVESGPNSGRKRWKSIESRPTSTRFGTISTDIGQICPGPNLASVGQDWPGFNRNRSKFERIRFAANSRMYDRTRLCSGRALSPVRVNFGLPKPPNARSMNASQPRSSIQCQVACIASEVEGASHRSPHREDVLAQACVQTQSHSRASWSCRFRSSQPTCICLAMLVCRWLVCCCFL